MITISTKLLKAICEFASQDATRSHLHAVNFAPAPDKSDRCHVVAVDGHTMVIANLPRVSGESFAPRYVPLPDLRLAMRVAGATGHVTLSFPESHSTEVSAYDKAGILLTSNVVCLPKCSNPFPAYMNVLPDMNAGITSHGIDTKYFARIAGVSVAMGVANNAAKLVCAGAFDPIRYDIQSPAQNSEASVVIMPVRYDAGPINWRRH